MLPAFSALTLAASFLATPAYTDEDTPARQFAAAALALRAAVVAGEEPALDVLATMPGAGMTARETLPALWSPSFANAIVKLGRLRSAPLHAGVAARLSALWETLQNAKESRAFVIVDMDCPLSSDRDVNMTYDAVVS